jgi:hypothetical protein
MKWIKRITNRLNELSFYEPNCYQNIDVTLYADDIY